MGVPLLKALLYKFKYLKLEQIIEDLYSNYTTTPRGGVTINVKNAMVSGASLPDETLELIVLLRARSWTIILQ